jgi:transcriptional regulator with XRE-family HTH domain
MRAGFMGSDSGAADEMDPDELGRRIRQQRCVLSLTQEQLAERAGISKETIGRLEQGVGSPTLETLFKVAGALRTTGSVLLATSSADEVVALVASLPERELEVARVMLRALSVHVSSR